MGALEVGERTSTGAGVAVAIGVRVGGVVIRAVGGKEGGAGGVGPLPAPRPSKGVLVVQSTVPLVLTMFAMPSLPKTKDAPSLFEVLEVQRGSPALSRTTKFPPTFLGWEDETELE